MKTCDDLGVPIVPEKTVGPSTVLYLILANWKQGFLKIR